MFVVACAAAAVLWAILAAALTVEVVTSMTRPGPARRCRLPTPFQVTVSALLGAYALTRAANPASSPPESHRATVDSADATTADDPSPLGELGEPSSRETPLGLTLPDGSWLPDPLANAITAAASVVWQQRRRDYQPDPDGRTRHLGLEPLPPTVSAVSAAADATTDPSSDVRSGTLFTPRELPAGATGMTGPGAADAVRGVIVSLFLDPDGSDTVVSTRETLEALLIPAVDASTIRTLDQFPTLAGVDELAAMNGYAGGLTLVALAPSDPESRRRLRDLLTATGAVAVLLGQWDRDRTWHVDTDGHVYPDQVDNGLIGRLCTLKPQATADLLRLAAVARGTAPEHARTAPTIRYTPPPRPGSSDAQLRLRILGKPELLHESDRITVRRAAAWPLLVYLAQHPHGATTAQLAAVIWPGERTHATRDRLYTTVSELRRNTAIGGTQPVVERDGDHYRLHPATDVDVWHLMDAIDRAARATTEQGRITAWTAVTSLYQGELAEGHRWPWIQPHRERLRRAAIDSYVGLADHAGPTTALQLLQRAAAVDPLNVYLPDRIAAVQAS
ncbi:hypothetical protein Afe04nite_20930 [Asanoa ferruginea]|nr:hypothetical protein Afe04nite_20930 [Asanoa ferruginea]